MVNTNTTNERGVGSVRCALVGDEPLVAQCADLATAQGLEVVLIATTNRLVQEYAAEQGIAVVGNGDAIGQGLAEHPVDVLFSIANLRLIPDDVLAQVATAINFHDGPLPGYAGLNVTTWALLAGAREHAITWHLMTADVDAGEVVASETFPIDADETAFSLNARCYEAALSSFPAVAAALARGDLRTEPQPAGTRRTFMRHDRPAQIFDPARSAGDTVRAVRALDLGHWLRNSIGSVRWMVGDQVLVIDAAFVASDPSGHPAGTVVSNGEDGVRIATSDGDIVVSAVSTATGRPLGAAALSDFGVAVGRRLPSPPSDLVEAISETESALSRHELFWIDRLAANEPTALSSTVRAPSDAGGAEPGSASIEKAGADETDVVAAVALWLSRVAGSAVVSFAVSDRPTREALRRTAPLTREPVAVIDVGSAETFADLRERAAAELEHLRRREPLLVDAIGRDPRTRGRDFAAAVFVDLDVDTGAGGRSIGNDVGLHVAVGDVIGVSALVDVDDPAFVERAAGQIAALLASGRNDPAAALATLEMIGSAERATLDAFNDTVLEHDRVATVATLFHARAGSAPDQPAVSFGDRTLSYRELEAAAATLGRRLASVGIGRGDRVGIAVPRGIEMLAGVIATLDLGAAYVPLDPTYPIDRLRFMVEDSGIKALLATGPTAQDLGQPDIAVVDPAHDPDPDPDRDRAAGSAVIVDHDPRDLAYVIYTSGSTGKPKGVMLEHREVTNFFAAMDEVIDTDPAGTWLAVTSLSFDISVLELLWTVTRGFHVVIKSDRGIPVHHDRPEMARRRGTRPVTFSLFYFAAGEDAASDGYRLLLDSARFADANGFEAVWTPERHFHAFGGAYPNPSVTGAALAAITKNVSVRAGSVVLPLHSPVRVAEEWAVVDNLSRGRVGISFAAGWQPNDFVLNPGAYATAKEDLPRSIDTVQRLWRGEAVSLPGHDGAPVEVRTLPRPVQPELPTWLTSAGSPATFERAGTLGANVLTHLLGQSIEQLTENLQRYRTAWREAGHAGEGRVSLMMHTYLDRDADVARETAREPMKSYLSTAVGLLRDVASAFPTFAGRGKGTDDLFKSLTPDEMDQLLEVAAHRYLGTSGLFGTPADVADLVEQVSEAGVDEVACLIDFGVDTDDALRSLDLLLEAKAIVDESRASAAIDIPISSSPANAIDPADDTVAALVARHGVTHLQCTPSLAAMLVADPADRAALGQVQHLMLGGEALSSALAAELRGLLPSRFTNMYGPTETTIWSLTHEIDGAIGASIPIGRPIANTTVFVLDRDGGRLGVGAFGELHIGGESVARGYHNRPDLTAERFVDRPGMGRVYATGDVVRLHPAGYVEFAGRADNQVKIRGHRIELGEIETVIDRHPDVVQSVVVAREDSGDTRLVAYAIVHHGADFTADSVRKFVGEVLPDVMVPAVVVRLEAFPLTPNGKIDRKALPAPPSGLASADIDVSAAPPADDMERLVAEIWVSELERPVGRDDNFFDIGGHSLLAVKVFRRLTDAIPAKIGLTDIFRFPTVRTFAAHMSALQGNGDSDDAATVAAPAGTDRGAMRRRALARRGTAQEG